MITSLLSTQLHPRCRDSWPRGSKHSKVMRFLKRFLGRKTVIKATMTTLYCDTILSYNVTGTQLTWLQADMNTKPWVCTAAHWTLRDRTPSNPPQTWVVRWIQHVTSLRRCPQASVPGHVSADFSRVVVFARRVFVNRNLTLENIKCYGFDMDYTMASMWRCRCSRKLFVKCELCCISFWIFSWSGRARFTGFMLMVFLCVFVCVCSV